MPAAASPALEAHALLRRAAAGERVLFPPRLARQLLAANGVGELADLLGLSAVYRIRRRNASLCAAVRSLIAPDDSRREAARRLASAMARFESRIAPRLQRGEALELGPCDHHLAEAFRAAGGGCMPRSERALFDILSAGGL